MVQAVVGQRPLRVCLRLGLEVEGGQVERERLHAHARSLLPRLPLEALGWRGAQRLLEHLQVVLAHLVRLIAHLARPLHRAALGNRGSELRLQHGIQRGLRAIIGLHVVQVICKIVKLSQAKLFMVLMMVRAVRHRLAHCGLHRNLHHRGIQRGLHRGLLPCRLHVARPGRLSPLQELLFDFAHGFRVDKLAPIAGLAAIVVGNPREELVEPAVFLQQLLHSRHAVLKAAQLVHAREVDFPTRLSLDKVQDCVRGLRH
mmetsp:Transcript_5093/g.13014  ORF Transcript_5093/g.13014 Transcript_5093/m.13014 type:complete len:258 (+) Transcript_5093:469-1242(+)